MLALRRGYIFLPLAILCYAPMILISCGVIVVSQGALPSFDSANLGLVRFAAELLTDVFCASLFLTLALSQISMISGALGSHDVSFRRTPIRIVSVYICGLLVALFSWIGILLLVIPGLFI